MPRCRTGHRTFDILDEGDEREKQQHHQEESAVVTAAVTAIAVMTTIKTATTVQAHALLGGADHLPPTAILLRSAVASVVT